MITTLRRTAFLLAALTIGTTSAQIKLPFLGGITGKADYQSAIPLGSVVLFQTPSSVWTLNDPVTLKPIQRLKTDISLRDCEQNVTLSPDGSLLAMAHDSSILVYDVKSNKPLIDFEGPCGGFVFLDNDRLYTPEGVVKPKEGVQEQPSLPSVNVYQIVSARIITSQGDLYNLKEQAYEARELGAPEGSPFGSLMLFKKDSSYRVVNVETGGIVAEFDDNDAMAVEKGSFAGAADYISLLDSGRVVAVKENEVYVMDLGTRKAKLFLSFPSNLYAFRDTAYDPVTRRLFLPDGQYLNLK